MRRVPVLALLCLALGVPAEAQQRARTSRPTARRPVASVAARTPNPRGPFARSIDPVEVHADSLVAHSRSLLGIRYVWAGATPERGLDCSGLVQYVFGRLGLTLPHSAAQLATLGCELDFRRAPRELNGEADMLANEAMDSKRPTLTRGRDYTQARTRLPLQEQEPDEADELDEPGPTTRAGRIPRLDALPSREQLHAMLADVHRDSRVLGRLLPSKLWPAQTTLAWTSACARFTPRLAVALDSESELEMTQMLLDLIELPALVLREHCPGLRPEDVRRARAGETAAAAAARGAPPVAHPDPPGAARGGRDPHRRSPDPHHQRQRARARRRALRNDWPSAPHLIR